MIRKMQNPDINRVADIWLKTNLKAHYFIPEQYWKSNYELVKDMMSQSEVYVFEADQMIQGFVGLNNEYIEGAISFYQREGFIIQCEGLDEATGEKERPVSVLDMSLARIVIRRFYR